MKNILSILLVIAVMGVGAKVDAQQPTKIPRIGFLITSSAAVIRTAHGYVPAGSARAWLRGGEKHRH